MRSPAKIDTRLASLGLSCLRGPNFSACCLESLEAARLPVGFPILGYPVEVRKSYWKISQSKMLWQHDTISISLQAQIFKQSCQTNFNWAKDPLKMTNCCPNFFLIDAADLFAHYACVITWHAYPRASRQWCCASRWPLHNMKTMPWFHTAILITIRFQVPMDTLSLVMLTANPLRSGQDSSPSAGRDPCTSGASEFLPCDRLSLADWGMNQPQFWLKSCPQFGK